MRALGGGLLLALVAGAAPAGELAGDIDRAVAAVEAKVVQHRRHIHQHPELGNRETETAKYVARHLKKLGLDVKTGVARTGVIGVLRGGRPGPVVALRADMDALPVAEEVEAPFKSTVRTTYDGKDVGVMHACGHDAHVGILLGVAETLAQLKDRIPGTVKFIFQPAEEGAPAGEEGGAGLMIREGVLENPRPEAIFGLHVHVVPTLLVGQVGYRAGGFFASADDLEIVVSGKQTHGAAPWLGVDPIVVASQIVLGLQTITSRQLDLTRSPAVVTIGKIEGGVRSNIIPERVVMKGTLRTLDADMRKELHERVRRTVEQIAASAGAGARVTIGAETAYPVTYNDPALTARMLPTLRRVAGDRNVVETPVVTGAEDFSMFQEKIPGLYILLGIRTPGSKPDEFPSNHSPRFRIDEAGLPLGVRALAHLAVDYLESAPAADGRSNP
jgi:amidohydrolase